jgi:hypothetical protein
MSGVDCLSLQSVDSSKFWANTLSFQGYCPLCCASTQQTVVLHYLYVRALTAPVKNPRNNWDFLTASLHNTQKNQNAFIISSRPVPRFQAWVAKQPDKPTVERMVTRTLRFTLGVPYSKYSTQPVEWCSRVGKRIYHWTILDDEAVELHHLFLDFNQNLPSDIRWALAVSETNAKFNVNSTS